MNKIFYLLGFLLAMSSAHGAQIDTGGFSGSEFIEDFTTLGVAPPDGPFHFSGMTFSENSGAPGWRYLFSSRVLADNSGISNITIDFDNVFSRVGLDVGFTGSASYDVSFYDSSLSLLGVVSGSTTASGTSLFFFAAWENDLGISRINILETSGPNSLVSGLDNIRFENEVLSVPAPAAIWLIGIGLMGLVRMKKRHLNC